MDLRALEEQVGPAARGYFGITRIGKIHLAQSKRLYSDGSGDLELSRQSFAILICSGPTRSVDDGFFTRESEGVTWDL